MIHSTPVVINWLFFTGFNVEVTFERHDDRRFHSHIKQKKLDYIKSNTTNVHLFVIISGIFILCVFSFKHDQLKK